MILQLGWDVIRAKLKEKGYTEEQFEEIKEIIQEIECE